MEHTNNIVAILGVVYSGVESYLENYFLTLCSQTYKKLDVWIFNDGLSKELLGLYKKKYYELNIYIETLENKCTPAEVRYYAISRLKNKYQYLIFTDTDDYISSDRVEKSVQALNMYDFCYNNMILVDENGERILNSTYFENKNNPKIVYNYHQLLKKNYCGLSNTAINLNNVNLDFLIIPSEIIAVDWWIYSLLLIKRYKGCYLSNTYTFYRQCDTNTVGGFGQIDEKKLLFGIAIKKMHYRLLLKYFPSEFNKEIQNELDMVIELENRARESSYLLSYLETINKSGKEYFWWENIVLKEDGGSQK